MPYQDPSILLSVQLFVLGLAVLLALLEIQVEGPHGWASALPTWRVETPFIDKLLHGKPITGYHVYLTTFLLVLFHFPVLLVGWTWELELTILLAHATLIAFEDFLWFMLNPYYGWQRFSEEYIWWFTKWWGVFPADYYFWFIIAGSCAALRGLSPNAARWLPALSGPVEYLIIWLVGLALCGSIIYMIVRFFQPKARIHAYSRGHRHQPGPELNMVESL